MSSLGGHAPQVFHGQGVEVLAEGNALASQSQASDVVVVLDPDVSEVFTTSDSVNQVLRALIKTMPTKVQGSEP